MAVEGVPLFIGGGEARHSAELMRMDNFFGFRGQEGWLTASSGACTELPTPGAGIQIAPGPFLINSRFPGGAMQSYCGRVLTGTNVDAVAVPPGNARSDLVVMNIEDPYPTDGSQWQYPGAAGSSSRQNGPYCAVRIIQDVPSTCLTIDDLDTSRPERGWTCISIARIDRPQNTGTITNAMIKNLRAIINPWAGIQLPQEILDNLTNLNSAVSTLGDEVDGLLNQKIPVPASGTNAIQCYGSIVSNTVYNTDTTYKPWPVELNQQILLPPWADHIDLVAEVIGAYHQTGSASNGVDANVFCGMRLKINSATSTPSFQEFVEPSDVYYSGCPDKRATRPAILCNPKFATSLTINPQDIGKVVNFRTEVAMNSISNGRLHNGVLIALPGISSVYVSYQFKEKGQH